MMAETLGEALLVLRTDDSGLGGSMAKAKAGAEGVGAAFDRTRSSTQQFSREITRLKGEVDPAWASLQKYKDEVFLFSQALRQGAINQSQYTKGILASRTAYQETVAQLGRTTTAVTTATAAQRAGLQNLGRQVGDIATMYALGARPSLIFASQIGQVTDAVQMATGGTSKLASFLRGPWGIGLMIAVQALGPFIGKLFETKTAIHDVELAADSMGQAQSAMGGIFDLTTGKIKSQNEMLRLNARLLAYNLQAQAAAKRQSAHDTFVAAQQRSFGDVAFGSQSAEIGGFATTAGARNAAAAQKLLQDIGSGRISREAALKRAESMDFRGTRTTREKFMAGIRDSAWASEAARLGAAINKGLDGGELDPMFRQPRPKGRTKGDTGPSAAEVERQYQDKLDGLRARIAGAEQQTATSAEEQAELELRQVENAHRQAARAIANDDNLNAAQKKRLQAAEEEAAQADREAVEFKKQQRLAQESQALADERYKAESDALRQQYDLADTEAERKRIALQILDADDAYLKAKLEAVIASRAASDAEKRNAQVALAALNATAGVRREGVARANETSVERYLRDLNRTPEQINEAIDRIKISGLEELNDSIAQAIMGTKSLGHVFHDVAGQIIADLVRIAVQRAIVAPLANALFPAAAAGPANLLAGTPAGGSGGLFGSIGRLLGIGGARALGGPVVAGTPYLVGERGPELFVPQSAGTVLPNGTPAAGGAVRVVIEDTTGLFRTRVEQISGNVVVQAAPALVEASASETARRLTRPRI